MTDKASESTVTVLDLPVDATPAETADIIAKHGAGQLLVAVIPWPGSGARAFLRRYTQPQKRDGDAAEPQSGVRRYANPDGKDGDAEEIIRKYPKMKPPTLADKLAQHGIVRTSKWVYYRRKAMERAATAAAVNQA